MIEKLVAMIRANHKSKDLLVLSDILESHGHEITEEIVGAALCRMLGMENPPEDVLMIGMRSSKDHSGMIVDFEIFYQDLKSSDVKRLYDSIGKVVYGDGPYLSERDTDGKETGRISMMRKNWGGIVEQ